MRYSKNSVRGSIVVALISIGLLGMSACPSWLPFASCAAADIDSVAPPSVNPFQADFSGGSDGLAPKFDPAGSKPIYSTCLGGPRYDYAKGIAADPQGEVYVTGETGWADFPEADALGSVGPEAKGLALALRAVPKNQDKDARQSVANALSQTGPKAKKTAQASRKAEKTVSALRAELKDQDVNVRRSAALTLALMKQKAKEAVPDLIAALKDQDADVRWATALALAEIGPAAKEAVPALRDALKDQDKVASQSATALGQIGPEAKEAVPDLRAALKDQDDDVRRAAAEALRKIGR
jgi:HEAT repeats/Beta-propeller repeat/HEAT repeat